MAGKMTLRKITSLSLVLSFVVLIATGFLAYFQSHARLVSMLHTVFGLIFTLGVGMHFYNNFKPVKKYMQNWRWVFVALGWLLLLGIGFLELPPFDTIMNFGTKLRAKQTQEVDLNAREVVEFNAGNDTKLTIDLVRGEHYWHPQMAIWTEDIHGKFLETIFVSKATAKGLFFGGRSKENFKSFDEEKEMAGNDFRRVNALPIWSHHRGEIYSDGMVVPHPDDPLPDAITGATLSENFLLRTSSQNMDKFKLFIEINVAFDDNEHFSEYDFPDDETFHSGTGQLGQPSILFASEIDMKDGKNYYLMDLIGRGHHSGMNGKIYEDLSSLTTALEIVERIVVGVTGKSQE